jgi:hypothetical protein
VRRAIWSVDRNVAVTLVASLGDLLAQFAYAEPRLVLVILGVFALLGLVLVALGVFSVTAYAVSRQTHEIGIRMALGAGRGDVLRHVLQGAFRRVGPGRRGWRCREPGWRRACLAHQLFGVTPYDPATLSAVVTLVLVVGFLACYLPARRASASSRRWRCATSDGPGSGSRSTARRCAAPARARAGRCLRQRPPP